MTPANAPPVVLPEPVGPFFGAAVPGYFEPCGWDTLIALPPITAKLVPDIVFKLADERGDVFHNVQ